jgi:hypothetical protein
MKPLTCLCVLLLLLATGRWLNAQTVSPNISTYPTGSIFPQKSISIYCITPTKGTYPVLSATAATNEAALNGINYNNGSAMQFKVRSDKPYTIRISANNAGGSTGSLNRPVDIRDYIFFSVIDNRTGGVISSPEQLGVGCRIGTEEKTIISGCPPTTNTTLMPNGEEDVRDFSLSFKLRVGYSIPPGTYSTNILITASYE